MSIDTTALERYLDLLERGGDQIDREAALELAQTELKLAEYAQEIAHRKSGFMADSIHAIGPFAISSDGVLESEIASLAPYTIFELARGGDHDWASRTLDEQSAELDRLQDATGRIVSTAIGGGA